MYGSNIGKVCHACNTHDYLPSYCGKCDKYYCGKHTNNHICINSYTGIMSIPKQLPKKIVYKCKKCDKKLNKTMALECKSCKCKFCVSHFRDLQHECPNKIGKKRIIESNIDEHEHEKTKNCWDKILSVCTKWK